MPDPIKNIDQAKNRIIHELGKKKDEIGEVAYHVILETVEKVFNIEEGQIVVDPDFIQRLNRFTDQVIRNLQNEPRYTGPISKYIKRMPELAKEISTFQKTEHGITVPEFESSKKVVISEILDRMLDSGLNQHFVQPLRDLIYRNATAGLSLREARGLIREYIVGGKDESGKLGRYLEQTAIQGVDSYTGMINLKILQKFNMDALLMVGSLIETSSPQCRFVREKLNSRITRDNWPVVEVIAQKNGLIEGTDFDNLPLNKNHWACRHEFFPIKLISK